MVREKTKNRMNDTTLKFKPIIGLEIHIELKTESKMFCSCKADYFGKEPNTQTCPTCLGLPGALPVPNKKAVEWCIKLGLALDCEINKESYFERKNYFYPDLPKGYQISQYTKPFCINGTLTLSNGKTVRINRVHMEEDTGKLTHEGDVTLIDYNRSSVPLVEVVSEPDIETVDEAKEYCEKIQKLVRALNISDADMEKGTMRLEPTINLEIEKDRKKYYTPLVELKNINSFRFVKNALEYEITRQLEEFENSGAEKDRGNKTTRGYNEDKGETYLQRSKEEANDYRYFPEPDIPPFEFSSSFIESIRSEIPELPEIIIKRLMGRDNIPLQYAKIIAASKDLLAYYERAVALGNNSGINAVAIANLVVNKKVDIEKVKPEELITLIQQNKSGSKATSKEVEAIVLQVLNENPKALGDIKNGKEQAIGFIIGIVKRENKDIEAEDIRIAIQKTIN